MMTRSNQPNALRPALLLDAVASGGMGILLVVASTPLERLLGLPLDLLRYTGMFLIPFAAVLVWLATRRTPPRGIVRMVVVGNLFWVAASVLLLVSGVVHPTLLGEAFVLLQALAVLLFAYLEHRGLRQAQATLIPERA